MPYKDHEKQKAAYRLYYERHKAQHRSRMKRQRQKAAEWLAEYKLTLSCIKCGESHPACIEFHHRDPSQKDIGVGDMAKGGYSVERMMEEIAKCDVLCSNCHRKHHYEVKRDMPEDEPEPDYQGVA